MNIQLVRFWIKRFFQILILVFVSLVLAEYFESGYQNIDLFGVVLWSNLIAFIVSTVNSFWAYKKHCKLVYKTQQKEFGESGG